MTGIVKIIYDMKKHKLRAVNAAVGGYVRFPRNLRIEGNEYIVEDLAPGKSGSWIAKGKITLMEKITEKEVNTEIKKNGMEVYLEDNCYS